jgi:hypothetical protein
VDILYTVSESRQEPSIVVAHNDTEAIYFAKSFGGTNIVTIQDAISYLITGSTGTTIVNIDYPNIVTSGLILNLDYGFIPSYYITGNKCYDLSGNNNTSTLFNYTYTGTSYGCIIFNGIGASPTYANITSSPTLTNQITCEHWVRIDTSNIVNPYGASWISGKESAYRMLAFSGTTNSISIGWVCATVNNGWYTAGTAIGSGNFDATKWHHFVGTYNGSYNSIYVDGNLVSSGSTISGNIVTNGNLFQIGKVSAAASGGVVNGKGLYGISNIYNRALTLAEIQQNFNALKSRYGL